MENKIWFSKRLLGFLLILFMLASVKVYPTAPPRPGDIEQYKKDGSLEKRLQFAEKYQNYKVHPDIIKRLKARFQAEKEGKKFDPRGFPYKTGLPSHGSPKIFVLPIEFPDHPHTQDVSRFQNYLFGDGDPNNFPYESLKNYYYRSSYGQLTITGDVMPWHMASQNRGYYTNDVRPVIMEALDALNDSVDFTQYDNNGDGEIDYFICYWTGEDTGWNTTFWAWCDISGGGFRNDPYKIDGKSLGVYSWVWEKNDKQDEPSFMPRVSMHETGHGLGLPDYYDYKAGVGPNGGLGGMDMMDNAHYDHNAFSKFLLDWMGAYIVGDSNVIHNLTLRNADTFPDAVVIMPNQQGLLFDEYFVVENRIRSGNDATETLPGYTPLDNEGLVIYHVDATLNAKGDNFAYDNSYTSHKLLRMMEADGQENIEKGNGSADAGDFYLEGASFSSATKPNSNSYYYSPKRDGAYVTNISPGWSARSATYINAITSLFPDLNTVLDNKDLHFSTGGDSLWYGIQKSDAVNMSAAQSGQIADGQNTWIKMTVQGQGTITFDWKVSSQQNGDYLEFDIDNVWIKSISGEVNWTSESFRVTKTTMGTQTFLWKYRKNSSGSAGQDRGWLDNVQWTPIFPTLNEALDNTTLVWTANGDNGWYGQTATFFFGGSAAKSDTLSDGQSAWLNTQITGPGTLNFVWRASSELNADYLRFLLDGYEEDKISGATTWLPRTQFIKGDGTHYLTWKYQKNTSGSAYYDCGYLDKVEFLKTGELAEAVDNNMLEFTTGPSYKWYYQNYFSYYGGDAAQSGYTPASGESYIQTTVDAPGLLTFYWKVSSEQNHDYLEFCIDDMWQQRISGEHDWAFMNDIAISGPCTLKWRYVKDGSGIGGYDCGWVDHIIYNYEPALSDAVDNHYLPLKTFGDKKWNIDNAVHYFGSSSISAGKFGEYSKKTSSVQTCLTGPGTLKFYWKASTEGKDYAPLKFIVDNVEIGKIGGIVDWQQVSFALSPGTHAILWTYESYGDTYQNEDTVWLDKVEYIKDISLNEAIDNKSLVLDTYDQVGGWFGVEDVTAYCGAAARSGAIPDNQTSFLETTVNGPRNLSFNWKVSSEPGKDSLEFYIDDVFKDKISGSTAWQQKNYILNIGQHTLSWRYYKDASGSAGSDCGWIDKVILTATPTIAEALDFTGFVWSTNGNVPWVGQTFTSYYDGDAAQSGAISGNQYSRLYTTIVGPGLFSFYWKVSSQQGWDFLEFDIDGQRRNHISGEVDWQQKTYIIDSGSHQIEWKYSKNSAFNDGADCGWVDRIQWSPGIVPDCQLYVPYQYPTIQEAINSAREGCVIYVSAGVYYENITISGKNIVLSSFLPGDRDIVRETIIDGGQKGSVITFGGDEYYTCKVAGLTITNGKADKGGGIAGNYTQATIEDCIITSNTATQSGGGVMEFNGIIQRNIITNNNADFAGGGIFHCSGTIQNNFIFDNSSAQYGGGIGWCNGVVHNNTIYGNSAGTQGGGSFGSNTQPKNCIFWNDVAPLDPEIYYNTSTSDYDPLNCLIMNWTGSGTNIQTGNPLFINASAENFHIRCDSPCVDNGCDITGMTEDIDRDARPIDVYFRPRGVSHFDIGADEYTNTAPEINILAPEGQEHAYVKSYEIMWSVTDVNYESSTSLTLVQSNTDSSGFHIVSGIKSVSSRMTYLFNYDSAPEGIFHIYGKISDGFHAPSESWSPGTIRISKVGKEDLINHLLQKKELPPERLPYADINNDGIIDIADLIYFMKL
jgi:M6 family metalloprotease-like protein